ncbi:MAG: family ATPase [Clostridiales bacterium]|jgi:SpoVK/Ycf46/Vps4 family AAA+-type ATPase|nr:family ATPase [Clostridiales bacterium]
MIEQDQNNAYAWYLLGNEYNEMEMPSEALQAFSEAIKYSDEDLKYKVFDELGKLSQKKNQKVDECECSQENNIEIEEKEDNIIPLRLIIGGGNDKSTLNYNEGLPNISFEDVGGLENLKETIKMKIVKPFVNQGLFDKFRKKVGGGILLFGPPGCGKTFIARATAGECNASFVPVHITDILDPYLGVSAQNIKDIFSNARTKKPCILFFDEIDTIGYNRSRLSGEHMRPIIDQLLSEIEGIDSSTDKLLIIGATNMPWDVDTAFKRPGRFDKTIFVSPPDQGARALIFKLKLKDRPTDIIDYNMLAKNTELYSGADIENVVEVATENVITEILSSGVERLITMNDLVEAIKCTKPSTIEWLRTIKNYVKYSNQAGVYDEVEKFLASHKGI